jgi:hypothetical protein
LKNMVRDYWHNICSFGKPKWTSPQKMVFHNWLDADQDSILVDQ